MDMAVIEFCVEKHGKLKSRKLGVFLLFVGCVNEKESFIGN